MAYRELDEANILRTLERLSFASRSDSLARVSARSLPSEVILGAVNEIETLTTGLSNKIWQKIMMIERER